MIQEEMKRFLTSVTPRAGNVALKAGNVSQKEVVAQKEVDVTTGKEDLKQIEPELESPASTFRSWKPLQKKVNKYEVEENSTGDTQDTEEDTIKDNDTFLLRTILDSDSFDSDDFNKAKLEDEETSLTDCSLSTFASNSSRSSSSSGLSECSSNSILENGAPVHKTKTKNAKEEEKVLRAKHESACYALKVQFFIPVL